MPWRLVEAVALDAGSLAGRRKGEQEVECLLGILGHTDVHDDRVVYSSDCELEERAATPLTGERDRAWASRVASSTSVAARAREVARRARGPPRTAPGTRPHGYGERKRRACIRSHAAAVQPCAQRISEAAPGLPWERRSLAQSWPKRFHARFRLDMREAYPPIGRKAAWLQHLVAFGRLRSFSLNQPVTPKVAGSIPPSLPFRQPCRFAAPRASRSPAHSLGPLATHTFRRLRAWPRRRAPRYPWVPSVMRTLVPMSRASSYGVNPRVGEACPGSASGSLASRLVDVAVVAEEPQVRGDGCAASA